METGKGLGFDNVNTFEVWVVGVGLRMFVLS